MDSGSEYESRNSSSSYNRVRFIYLRSWERHDSIACLNYDVNSAKKSGKIIVIYKQNFNAIFTHLIIQNISALLRPVLTYLYILNVNKSFS